MKQRIFNRGKGWYISASNYKDKDDRAYMNVRFAVCTEPEYRPAADNPFVFKDIDIKDQKYECKDGKMYLTVFHYELAMPKGELTELDKQGDKYATSVEIKPEELPFY